MEDKVFLKALKKVSTELYGVSFDKEAVLIGQRGISIKDGIVSLNDDKFDQFNDILFNIDKGGDSFDCRVVTMDPGRVSKSVLQSYGITKGEARVEPGIYRVKIGTHRGHIAFNQDSDIIVRRDANGDYIWDEKDPVEKGRFAINIHAQGVGKDFVSQSSLGCTVTKATWTEPGWLDFISHMQFCEKMARKENPLFSGFIYIVLNQDIAKNILGV
ncbi:hypothetical protein [Leptospira licerasiae]|uniref:Uncharacterized protein n=1 Tax=Leptospira licerasiae str. MMD4847 TaxID=1049971 RepID=A0ABP2RG16_9LEPT|nr:hypothetical protein [Leptospira licerasiae]EIE01443.1 hypothetical protein LEP1GSC185_3950 [Leptospira licerasiae serovar Varillal str. VAR 010]EJZ42294.1 hypothetical protein LEP1GSC178_0019 [Leptospira licerasiae str. MMD4847]